MEKLKLLTPSSAEAHYRVEDGRFGLWDVRDKCWLGDKDGPNVYTNKLMARMAATVSTEQFGRYILPKDLPVETWRLKDTVTAPITAVAAIARIGARA